MQRKVTPLWGEKKVVLRQTPRAVTPFGGLSVFIMCWLVRSELGDVGWIQGERQGCVEWDFLSASGS